MFKVNRLGDYYRFAERLCLHCPAELRLFWSDAFGRVQTAYVWALKELGLCRYAFLKQSDVSCPVPPYDIVWIVGNGRMVSICLSGEDSRARKQNAARLAHAKGYLLYFYKAQGV